MLIKTKRLILRPWRKEDFDPFAALNADKRVMEYFPSTLNQAESDDLAIKIATDLANRGWGLWAITIPNEADFVGFIGLSVPSFDAHFTPAVEVGWRLAYDFWGKGYATEGALAALNYAFDEIKLDEVVSFTPVQNERSRRVMEKIGMQHNSKDDFDHPKVVEKHPLRRHVLYRIDQEKWFNQSS